MKIAVLISGRGSNMLRLADHATGGAVGGSGYEIVLVAANTPCKGLGLAADRGLATRLIDRAAHDSKQAHEAALGDAIAGAGADIICLAGYMAVLSAEFVERFAARIINIHPSLLPDLKGLDTHERALAAGMDRHGATVHMVTAALDDGPILLQAGLDVRDGETAGDLAARVLRLEHALYPFVLGALASGALTISCGGQAWGALWDDGAAALAASEASIADRLADSVIWPDRTPGMPK